MSNIIFKHQALDNPAESIRLVHVKGRQNAPFLELCLSTHSITHIVPYFAVSYTWGDGLLTEDISINEHPKKVTKNCLYALEQIHRRYPSDDCSREPTYLWIDSICINQDDNDEKGHQVAMMGKIYAKATKVLACIGPEANNSQMLRSVLEDMKINDPQLYADRENRRFGRWSSAGMQWEIQNFLNFYPQGSPITRKEFGVQFRRACFSFAERSYWSRVWIIQEFTAPDRSGNDLEILCGHDSFSKAEINLCFYIASCLHRIDANDFRFRRIRFGYSRPCLELVLRFEASNPIPIGTLLFFIGDTFHCTKPEDRVYGLLPLVKWPDGVSPIQPVYKPSSALDLAELMISLTDEKPTFCKRILEALEICHDYEPLQSLVEARNRTHNSHEASRCGSKHPPRASKMMTPVLPLYRDNMGHLSALLHVDPGGLHLEDPVVKKAATLHVDGSIDEPQVLFAGSSIAGLLCGESREGDVILRPRQCTILVLRPNDRDGLYRLVGQGLLSPKFMFPEDLPSSRGILKWKLGRIKEEEGPEDKRGSLELEIERACQPGQKDLNCLIDLRAEPIEWLIWLGQDLSRTGGRDEESMFKRLYTKPYIEATIV